MPTHKAFLQKAHIKQSASEPSWKTFTQHYLPLFCLYSLTAPVNIEGSIRSRTVSESSYSSTIPTKRKWSTFFLACSKAYSGDWLYDMKEWENFRFTLFLCILTALFFFKPMHSLGNWWKKKSLIGFVYSILWVLKALWIVLSETINILRNLHTTKIFGGLRLFSDVWSENAALLERLMEIHSNPPITYNGFNLFSTGTGWFQNLVWNGLSAELARKGGAIDTRQQQKSFLRKQPKSGESNSYTV